MSNHNTGDGPETESIREYSPSCGVHASDSTRKNGASRNPSPIKKSKRQADRGVARAAFAATQRKEEEEDRFYRKPSPKKLKEKDRPRHESDNTTSNAKITKTLGKKVTKGTSGMATPSPTTLSSQSTESQDVARSTTISPPKSSKKRSKALPVGDEGNDTKEIFVKTKNHNAHNRKRRKLVYEAMSGPKRPIYGYALELISLVCNNAYCVTKTGSVSISSHNDNTSASDIKPPAPTKPYYKDRMKVHPQPHRVLDRPTGYTQESEPLRERLMRLQLRQRFASATSMGMSPIEFARKLLRLWGGTLEQVYETKSTRTISVNANANASAKTNAIENTLVPKPNLLKRVVSKSIEKNTNFSSLKVDRLYSEPKQAPRSEIEEELPDMGSGWNADIESIRFETSIGELEPRSIHPDALIGESMMNDNGLVHQGPCNVNFNSHCINSSAIQSNNASMKVNANIFGESNERIERTKKLIERRNRKNLKKTETMKALSSTLTICSRAQASDSGFAIPANNERRDMVSFRNSSPSSLPVKRKTIKRTLRKFFEDPNQLIVFKDMRLSHPEDEMHLNALHCFVRAELLEVYAIQTNSEKTAAGDGQHKDSSKKIPTNGESQNIVGMRCARCGVLPREERGKGQTMSAFFPKSIGEIYRGVCTWQRIHFPVCEHMPEHFRTEYKIRKEKDLTRGKKAHWIKSAFDLGLRNIDSDRNGLTYKPGTPFDLERALQFDCDPGGRTKKSQSGIRRQSSSGTKTKALVTRDGNATTAVSTFAGSRDKEFELFGKDIDQSLEESADTVSEKKIK